MVCCDECGRWQHTECHDRADASQGRPKRKWEDVDFQVSSSAQIVIQADGSVKTVGVRQLVKDKKWKARMPILSRPLRLSACPCLDRRMIQSSNRSTGSKCLRLIPPILHSDNRLIPIIDRHHVKLAHTPLSHQQVGLRMLT